MHLVRLDRLRAHLHVPHLHRQVVARDQVASAVAELHVGDRRDDLGEEAPVRRVLRLLEHCEERTAAAQEVSGGHQRSVGVEDATRAGSRARLRLQRPMNYRLRLQSCLKRQLTEMQDD